MMNPKLDWDGTNGQEATIEENSMSSCAVKSDALITVTKLQ